MNIIHLSKTEFKDMKKIGMFVILLMVVVFGYMGYDYLTYRSKNAVSDAGFVKSDSLSILSFKVGGKISKLTKQEGDSIKKGELIAKIDDSDFQIAKSKIQNSINSISNSIEALEYKNKRLKKDIAISEKVASTNISSYKEKIASIKLSIKAQMQRLHLLDKDTKRFKNLLDKKLISKNRYEKVSTSKNALYNKIASDKKALDAVQTKLENVLQSLNLAKNKELLLVELSKEIEALKYKKQALKDGLKEVEKKIGYCSIYAPFDGKIAKRFVNQNRVVAKGYPIFAVVNPKDIHAEVLLSEKKLHGVKVGNKVIIEADAVKDKKFHGVVESILPTSASTFSLVPRDIASGEFTKLDQRFVVRIALKEKEGLRVGMSLNVAIKRN